MRQRSDIEEKRVSVEYHTGIDEALLHAEEMKVALERTKASLSLELAEQIDQLFKTEDEDEQETILLEIIAHCPVEEQIALHEKLAGPIAEIERAVEAGEVYS